MFAYIMMQWSFWSSADLGQPVFKGAWCPYFQKWMKRCSQWVTNFPGVCQLSFAVLTLLVEWCESLPLCENLCQLCTIVSDIVISSVHSTDTVQMTPLRRNSYASSA